MSRWLTGLNQVSSLLEKLDDRVEIVAEQRAIIEGDDDDDGNVGGGGFGGDTVHIHDILLTRNNFI